MNFTHCFRSQEVYVALMACVGASTLLSAPAGTIRSKAMVSSVKGTVTYTLNGASNPVKSGMELEAGGTITTGPNSRTSLKVNGWSASVRLQAGTTLAIPAMERIGSELEGDFTTMLGIKVGSIVGHVRKASTNSTFDIETPHGWAGIHAKAADFAIRVVQHPDEMYSVTYTCVEGEVIVAAVVEATTQINTLHEGESWSPGEGGVHATAPSEIVR